MHGSAGEEDVKDLESALRGLRPRTDLDGAALYFRAGRESARGWAWPLAAGASAALAAVFGLLLLTRPDPLPVERVVYVTVPAPAEKRPAADPPSPEPAADAAEGPKWLSSFNPNRLSDRVLRYGLDGLPQPTEPPSTPPETPGSLLRNP